MNFFRGFICNRTNLTDKKLLMAYGWETLFSGKTRHDPFVSAIFIVVTFILHAHQL